MRWALFTASCEMKDLHNASSFSRYLWKLWQKKNYLKELLCQTEYKKERKGKREDTAESWLEKKEKQPGREFVWNLIPLVLFSSPPNLGYLLSSLSLLLFLNIVNQYGKIMRLWWVVRSGNGSSSSRSISLEVSLVVFLYFYIYLLMLRTEAVVSFRETYKATF